MAACDARQRYQVLGQQRFGTPVVPVFRIQVRINGMVQDAPQGYKIPECYLPDTVGVDPALGTHPISAPAPETPLTVMYGDGLAILTTPDAWGEITIDGNDYVFPLYNKYTPG